MVSNLNGGVVLALVTGFNPFQPLDNRLDVATHFALERRGATIVYSSVYWMSSSQDGLRVCALCNEKKKKYCNLYIMQLWVYNV